MDPDQVLAPQQRSPAAIPQGVEDMTRALLGSAYGTMQHLGHLPQRMFEASEGLRQTGEYNPAPMVETMGMLAGGGMPAAERGAAGIFGGALAKGADMENLLRAKLMQSAYQPGFEGFGRTAALEKTGWFQGPEGLWRFEIPDNRARLSSQPLSEIKTMGQYIQHPQAFTHYPDLAKRPVHFDMPMGQGIYESQTGHFHLGPPDPVTGTEIPLHELQHGIQQIEGFAPGGNPNMFKGTKAEREALYNRLAGEVEARNVQRRLPWTAAARRQTPPWVTEDIAPGHQIINPPDARLGEQYALKLKQMGETKDGSKSFHMLDEQGQPVGQLHATEEKPGRVYIDNIASTSVEPNTLGFSNMRSIIEALKGEFPGVKTIQGARVTGARAAAGKALTMPDLVLKVR